MGVKISKDRLLSQMDSKTKAEFLRKDNRPNKGEKSDILNFKHYFSGFTLIEGKHGPEESENKIYISVYHFLEYEGFDPHDYNTESIGRYLCTLTNDYKQCLYKDFPYEINKYDFNFLISNQKVFKDYKVK